MLSTRLIVSYFPPTHRTQGRVLRSRGEDPPIVQAWSFAYGTQETLDPAVECERLQGFDWPDLLLFLGYLPTNSLCSSQAFWMNSLKDSLNMEGGAQHFHRLYRSLASGTFASVSPEGRCTTAMVATEIQAESDRN